MSMFNMTRLANHQALVTGDADQLVILDTTEWDRLKATQTFDAATEDFDAAVLKFFAPLTAAAEAAEATVAAAMAATTDPAYFVVVDEGTEAVEGVSKTLIELDHDSAVVRLIELGETDRLLWAGKDRIVISALPADVEVPDFESIPLDEMP